MTGDAHEPVTLVFNADFSADPLWRRTSTSTGMVNLDQLPLSRELKSELRTWARRHDELQDPPNPVRGSDEVLFAWTAVGKDLVVRLRAALAPRFIVVDGDDREGSYPDLVADS